MKNMCDVAEKYDIRAPLVQLESGLEMRDYIRACANFSMTAKVTELVSQIAAECFDNEDRLTSINQLSKSTIKKSPSTIRAQLVKLEEAGLCEAQYVTTDPIRNRRGTLYLLKMPSKEVAATAIAAMATEPKDAYSTKILQTELESRTEVSEDRESYGMLFVVRYLVKAMRTNRKDRSTKFNVPVTSADGQVVNIVSEAEGGRLMAVPDLAYYSGAISWLLAYMEAELSDGKEPATETYNIPLHQLIIMSKKASAEDATSLGYGNAAIEGLRKISATTFNIEDIPANDKRFIQVEQEFIKLFRLERVGSYDDGSGNRRRIVTIQFPLGTVKQCWRAVTDHGTTPSLVLIEDDLLQSKNEIEILFGLWAKDLIRSGRAQFVRRLLNWNQLRELVAPNSQLSEFKRKFTTFMIEHRDETYAPSKDSAKHRESLVQLHNNLWVNQNGKREYILEYGKALAHGLIINVGYDESTNQTLIHLRLQIGEGLGIRFDDDFSSSKPRKLSNVDQSSFDF
ncbi:hypothetical protein K0504_10085 [Neiella marina]|uniref:Uncharacterized protein n=1 Tax=Neiella holothuriorum TaxID=2870530 RepID=A0ABS7EGB9_9GAMM|nr:hypothetical protein [Neiella holothuriorum]MBW8191387.1 hypothetical protein [Neiella holothuriorum]